MQVWNFCLNVYEHILALGTNLIAVFGSTISELVESLGDDESWFGSVISYLAELISGTSLGNYTLLEVMFSTGIIVIVCMGIYKFFFR